MSPAYAIPLALAMAAIVAMVCYLLIALRTRRDVEDLLFIALVAVFASCSTAPEAAKALAASVEVKP